MATDTDTWGVTIALLSFVFAGLSLALSAWVFGQQRKDREAERAVDTKRDNYRMMLEFYRGWLDVDEQRCRKVLYDARDNGLLCSQLSDEQLADINHALAMLNVVAVQRRHGNFPQGDSDDLFGSTILRCTDAAETIGYFEWRKELQGSTPWQDLRDVANGLGASGSLPRE